jgi:hypothetical protein
MSYIQEHQIYKNYIHNQNKAQVVYEKKSLSLGLNNHNLQLNLKNTFKNC